jgi:hypothetical protein
MTTITKTKNNESKPKLDLQKKVSIRQYCDPEIPNMGMEKYNMSIFSGENGVGGHKEWLGYRKVGNKKVYFTGLNVEADSIKNIEDDDVREQKISEIKSVLKGLEDSFGKGTLDATNEDFWREHFIEIRRPVIELDLTNENDLLLYYGILGGGYSEVASSFEAAKKTNRPFPYKFYLHQDNEVADSKVEITKLRNKAGAALEELDSSDPEKMFKVAKMLLPIEKGLNRRTPKSQIYEDLNDFIHGAYSKNEIKISPKKFLAMLDRDRADLNLQAIVKEALYQNFIVKNPDQVFWNPQTQVTYGRNENEIIGFLSNPIHADELLQINNRVDRVWK